MTVENSDKNIDFDLSDTHKELLDKRLENYNENPESYLNWVVVQNTIEKRLGDSRYLSIIKQKG